MTWRRASLYLAGSLAVIVVAAPFLSADAFRYRIQDAMERALHRKVQIGKAHFNLLTGPGFSLTEVTISDDPSVGMEPLAFVDTVQARIGLWSLLTGRIAISNLRLVDPSLNVVKRGDGVWNFQLLLDSGASSPKDPPPADQFPSIQIRSGRINFKVGDEKSTFYFSDADIDLDPAPDRLEFRFRGEPARTDRAAQSFGSLLFRGTWRRQSGRESALNLDAELDRSAIDQVVKLVQGHGVGLHGVVASRAHIAGPISNLGITGQLRVDDIHRWDLMPSKGGGWNLSYKGTLDLWNQNLRLETVPAGTPSLPLLVKFDAFHYLSQPRWALTADFREVPSATLLEVARHMGAPLPDSVVAGGTVTGVVGYSGAAGFQGQLRFEDTSLRLPSAEPIKFQTAAVLIAESGLRVGPATIVTPRAQTAELSGSYALDSGDMDFKITTDALDLEEIQTGTVGALGAGSLPFLNQFHQGTAKGWISYERSGANPPGWTGEIDLRNTRLDVQGLAEPVRISSAALAFSGDRVALTRVHGRAGDLSFAADYRTPHHLKLDIPDATPEQLQALLLPTLRPRGGLLSRTLRFGRTAAPDWLRNRKLDAAVKIDRLTVSGSEWTVARARMLWEGTSVRFSGIDARLQDASAMGAIRVDLAGNQPRYTVQGRIENLAYRAGSLSLEGTATADGTGVEIAENLKATGTFTGEDVAFAPDADFQTLSGTFALNGGGRLSLPAVQIEQASETFSGQGITLPDGKLLLELTNSKRQLKLTGQVITPPVPVAR